MRTSGIGILLFLVFSSVSLPAQNPPLLSQEIVVTASGVEEDLDSTPATATVIDRSMIDDRQARDVADLLREVPGLTVSRSGSAGKSTSLFTRGSNSTHTLVLWNGMEINNPYFAGYDWGRFSTAGVERIEVVRGPYSALYGSDAVAGAVNIFTRRAAPYLGLDVQSGQRGLFNANLAASETAGSVTAGATAERRTDDGWAPNDDFEQNAAGLSVDWHPGVVAAGFQGRYTAYGLGIPLNQSADGTELVPSLLRRQEGTELQMQVPVSWQTARTSTNLKVSQSRRDDDFSDPEDPYGYTEGTTRSATSRAALSFQLDAGSFGRIVTGGEYERAVVDDWSNFGTTLDGEVRTNRALFLEDRFSRPLSSSSRLEGSLGIRHDDFDTFGGQTSPRAALAWVHGRTKVRAALGDAFRAPSIGELYFPYSGNTELQPERSRSWEAGIDRELSQAGRVSLTLFHASYRNLIIFDNASYRFVNVGAASSRGLELAASRTFRGGVNAAISWTRLDTEEAETGAPLPRRPRNSGSASLGLHRGSVRVMAVVTHVGERADLQPVFPYRAVTNPAYTTADLSLGCRIGTVEPYVKVENLTDEAYQDVYGFPSPGRRAIAGIRFTP